MDVHKSFVVACVATTDSKGVTSYKSKRFSTFTGDLRKLALWLAGCNCRDVCMESTGKYWIPVFNVLEQSCNVVLAHPKYVKSIRGQKTDKKDAQWIADIFKHGLVSSSFIPAFEIRQTLSVLEELRTITGNQRWLFPSARRDGRCMSENTIRVALRSMGYTNDTMTAHGFKGMASTILNEHQFTIPILSNANLRTRKGTPFGMPTTTPNICRNEER